MAFVVAAGFAWAAALVALTIRDADAESTQVRRVPRRQRGHEGRENVPAGSPV
jgi:hypothetical protein